MDSWIFYAFVSFYYVVIDCGRGQMAVTALAILTVLTADVFCPHLVNQPLYTHMARIKLHRAHTVAAIPQAVVALGSVRGFVVDEQYIPFGRSFSFEDVRSL